jgi:hypothetical protein
MLNDYVYGIEEFEKNLLSDSDLMNQILDETFAQNLYASLCNVQWIKNQCLVSYSFRASAGLVAFLRNCKINGQESYTDFYCSGSEGTIFPEIRETLQRLGWSTKEYDV